MERRNLVFIFTDQQRHDTFAAAGNSAIRTPNLDRLASDSVVLRRAYCTSPVCTPSRASILTGLYPHTHGLVENNLVLDDAIPTIAEMADGYRSAYMGKWHLGNETVLQHGFDEWVSIEDYYYRGIGHRLSEGPENCSYHRFLVDNGFMPDGESGDYRYFTRNFATRVPEPYSKPAFLAHEADRFLADHGREPFLLYVNFLEPHPPYMSVNDDLYDPGSVALPPAFGCRPGDDVPRKYHFRTLYAETKGRHFPLSDERAWRRQIARYWGSISLVDTYVGRILDSIRRHGLSENTAVVFTSDHGDMMGDMGMIAKGVMYEAATRVPLLVRIPWAQAGPRIDDTPVSQIDLVPTLLDAFGLPWEGRTQGKSLLPFLRGAAAAPADDVFIEYVENPHSLYKKGKYTGVISPGLEQDLERLYPEAIAERSIVTADGWRLTLNQTGEHELYCLTDDPLELRNQFADPSARPMREQLRERFGAWQERTDDAASFPE